MNPQLPDLPAPDIVFLKNMKIIIAPDKFKGSLSSAEAAQAISDGIKLKAGSDTHVIRFPMADGGDGFNSVLQHYFHTVPVATTTVDPLHRPLETTYQWDPSAKLAIVEMAAASGLVLLKEEERNPLHTSSYGTGLLLKAAARQGASRIILGLGGSATNDAGIGILAALGFRFLDKAGKELPPTGESLLQMEDMLLPDPLPDLHFDIAADVENPLYGPQGAAFVYGPQKGATPAMVKQLDKGLKNFAALISRKFNKDISAFPGAGAAGGIAAGLSAFFDVTMKKGVEMVLQANELEKTLSSADLVITGEGKIDHQSGSGKVVGTLALLAKKYRVPCIAFCGLLEADAAQLSQLGLDDAYSLRADGLSVKDSMQQAYSLLRLTTASVIDKWIK